MTTVIAWVVEATWPACVEAARIHASDDAEVVLLHVTDEDLAHVAHGAFAGLMGRGGHDPAGQLADLGAQIAAELLDAAAGELGRPCTKLARTGRVEREVVEAAEGADLLIVARDGDRSHLGPHSLGPHSRFVVDHAPCPVLLVWPEPAPDVGTIPPPPPHPPPHHEHPPPPHPPPPHPPPPHHEHPPPPPPHPPPHPPPPPPPHPPPPPPPHPPPHRPPPPHPPPPHHGHPPPH